MQNQNVVARPALYIDIQIGDQLQVLPIATAQAVYKELGQALAALSTPSPEADSLQADAPETPPHRQSPQHDVREAPADDECESAASEASPQDA